MNELTEQERLPGRGGIPGFVRTDWFVMLCLYAAALIIHSLLVIPTTIFNLTPDEFSVTGVAAFFNGYDWSSTISQGGYYGYFQSLFYAPVFAVTDDPYMRYHLMLVVNGIFMSFIPPIVYYIGKKEFDLKKSVSLFLGILCGFYPCYILMTKYTWNETFCNLLPWVFILLMYKAIDCGNTVKKQILSVLGGLCVVAAYATHGRMIALLAAAVVLELVVLIFMKKRIFCLTGFFSSVVIAFIADKLLKDFFQDRLWLVGESGKTLTNTMEKMIGKLLDMDAEGIKTFFSTLAGHFFYFISSTWGFGAIFMVMIITAIVLYFRRRNKKPELDENGAAVEGTGPYINDRTAVLCLFVFLLMGAIFFVSVSFTSTASMITERADAVMYGRYTEAFYPAVIFTGLVLVYYGKLSLAQTFAGLSCAAVINVLTELYAAPISLGGTRMVSAMIMGLSPLRYGEKITGMPTNLTFVKIIITVMSILLVLVIGRLISKNQKTVWRIMTYPLAVLLLYTNVYCYAFYTVPQGKNSNVGAVYMKTAIDKLDGSGFDEVMIFNMAKDRFFKAQFLYPDLGIDVVTSFSKLKNSEKPDIILSDRAANLNMWLRDVYLVGDINSNVHIYACSDEAVEWARSQNYELSPNGYVEYTGSNIPVTESVTRENGIAKMPNGSSVYTQYFTVSRKDTYTFTAYGDGIENAVITLTSDKGAKNVAYTVKEKANGRLVIEFSASGEYENVRLKLTNKNSAPICFDLLTLEKSNQSPMAHIGSNLVGNDTANAD